MRKLVLLVLASFSSLGWALCEYDRPGLVAEARRFTEVLERFDETLHEANAQGRIVEVVHHFEEGILDFIQGVEGNVSCRELTAEFQHFHEDIQEIYQELSRNPGLFYQPQVLRSWNGMLPAYIRFQNTLY